MRLLALLTDFGAIDPYVGIMKGVVQRACPGAPMVDVTHGISPQDVRQAAFVLASAVPYFPRDTIFLAVVDPGVGTRRRAVVVETEGPTFVAPDNGILTWALELAPPRAAWRFDRPQYFLDAVSQTFHGRDVFAPVCGHLLCGVAPSDMGTPVPLDSLARFERYGARVEADYAEARISYVDRFGNLVTNLHRRALGEVEVHCVRLGDVDAPFASSYRDVPDGEMLCIWGSFDRLEVARSMGNAASALGLGVGDYVHVLLARPTA